MICTKTETRPAHGILAMLTIVFILGVSGKDVLSDELKSVGQSLKKNILIIAGPITGHGKNAHEYEKSAILLKHLLDRSDNVDQLNVSVVFNGWPDDLRLLTEANTIVMISDGGDRRESDHPLYVGDRLRQLEIQMKRGCGLVHLHWTTFHPSRYHEKITQWVGGYFDYQKGDASNGWYSAIKHYTEPIKIGEPDHPIVNGVRPFRLLEEFYYRIRFRENDSRLSKIVLSRPPGETKDYAVGWSVERKDGGRGFGFTGGHYFANWWDPNFRKMVLNAIVWTSGILVPAEGVQSKLEEPVKALVLTGYNHPAHDWSKTTAALIQVIENDPRVLVDVQEDPEFLASPKMGDYDLLVLNYSSWDRPGVSEKAKQGLLQYLENGGGLNIIHFANGSWTDTLPNKGSDWPEFRTKIVRRVWDHGVGLSGHDAFGNFRVSKTEIRHPVTQGLADFNTQDELYYRQQGPLPIIPLLTAKSRDTGKKEPMAWAYSYGKSRVFQTVLGHADVSVLMAGDLIRRAAAWSSGLDNLSFDPPVARQTPYLWRSGSQWKPKAPAAAAAANPPANDLPFVKGRFGNALNAKTTSVFIESKPVYQDPALTLECWIKIHSKKQFNIIAASETKSSMKHWELYTYAQSGVISVYLPGIFGEIKSDCDVCDGKWHFVGMSIEKQFVKLYVDGDLVKSQPINFRKHADTEQGFAVGGLVEKTIGCDGLIDDLRISRVIRDLTRVPEKPLTADDATVGLWSFDEIDQEVFPDGSRLKNPAQTKWQPVVAKPSIKTDTKTPKKITGHWGEDAIGFRWTEKLSEDNRWAFTKHGRFLASTIPLPGGYAEKGLVIKVGENEEASVCYDLSRLNLMAAWSGGFLEFHQARFGLIRHLRPVGSMLFHNQSGLGWNSSELHFRGLYSHADRQVLAFRIGQTDLLESPWLEKSDATAAICRDFQIGPNSSQLMIPISSIGGGRAVNEQKINGIPIQAVAIDNGLVAAAVIGGSSKAKIRMQDQQLWLVLEKNEKPDRFKVLIWRGTKDKIGSFQELVASAKVPNLEKWTEAGPEQWPEQVETVGVVAEQAAMGYAVDTIRLPFQNPYNSLFFVSGHDWFQDGTMAVATVHGEIWLAKNVDKELKNVRWKRYATGLYQPLGIKIVDDKVHVLCRDQIVRLHDRNGNDEADFYECFHSDVTTSTGVHDYVCCLEADRHGNFYYIHANDGVIRVAPDGKSSSVVATGFRNPNGMGVRKDGLVTAAPQEGEWTPASMVCEVIEGRHYGYRGPKEKTLQSPLGYEKPLVYLPRLLDNSSGGQFWSDSDRWGILKNQLFHLSYGKCTMHLVLRDVNDDSGPQRVQTQGAVIPLPFLFESGVCRGRFSPIDGQLYLSGLKGWTTTAVRDGCLQRVRFVSKSDREQDAKLPANDLLENKHLDQSTFLPIRYKVVANGIQLGFSEEIDPKSIRPDSISVQAWNYRYSKNYGSPEFKISSPNQQGRDTWRVNSARVFNEGHDLFIEIPGIGVADQVGVSMKLDSRNGISYESTIYATIKSIGELTLKPGLPFSADLTELEKRLQPGVHVKSHDWIKDSLDVFVARNAEFDMLRIANGVDSTNGLSMVAILKLSEMQTRLHVTSGATTSGKYRVTPLLESVQTGVMRHGILKPGGEAEIDLSGMTGFCRVEVDLLANNGDLQCQWSWSGGSFKREPIPGQATFHEPGWRQAPATPEFSARFLEAGQLFLDNQCIRCHEVGQLVAVKNQVDYRLGHRFPDLIGIGSRRSRDFLRRKILEPDFEKHGGRMPVLLDSESKEHQKIADDIATYLETLVATTGEDRDWTVSDEQLQLGERLFEQLGCIGCHHLSFEPGADQFDRLSLKFTAAKFSKRSLRDYLRNPQAHHPQRRMGNFKLTKAEAHALAGLIEKFSKQEFSVANIEKLAVDVTRGKERFESLGCVNCHQVSVSSKPTKLLVITNAQEGCLQPQVAMPFREGIPRLKMTDREKALLGYFLDEFKSGSAFTKSSMTDALGSTPLWRQASQIKESLRCNTCHTDSMGSAKLPEILYEEGVTGLNPERLPVLNQIGHKLYGKWMEDLLSGQNSESPRPWLKTRMPHFSGHSKGLSSGLVNLAGFDHRWNAPSAEPNLTQAILGQDLTKPNNGLDCLQCHGVGNNPPSGDEKTQIVLGVNFSLINGRLRRSFYDRWMLDPLRIDAQTKMPRYAADGKKTKIVEVLEGDAVRQFDAIWEYLKTLSTGKKE